MTLPVTLITGAGGQLADALIQSGRERQIVATSHHDLDISNLDAVIRTVDSVAPNLIVNAAAYTAVDAAESDEVRAFAVNRDGAAHVAEAASRVGARLVHISTDYVFSGACVQPWRVTDDPKPINTYGKSKLAGETEVLSRQVDAVVIRAGWLYSSGDKNFVSTIIRLADQQSIIRVVDDQIGCPTSAESLASLIWDAAGSAEVPTLLHWSDGGVASWYDFAVAIVEEAEAVGRLKGIPEICPIRTAASARTAARPHFSVLDCSETEASLGRKRQHWRTHLRRMIVKKVRPRASNLETL